MKRSFIIRWGVAIIVIAGLLLWSVNHFRVRAVRSQCVENLYKIQWAKSRWMSDNHKTVNDAPSWDDLKDELEHHGVANGKPVCPQGGTYTLGTGGEPPTCSLGGSQRGHALPISKP